MGIKSTVTLTRAAAEERVQSLMDEKRDRIVLGGQAHYLKEAVDITGIRILQGSNVSPLFGQYMDAIQFSTLRGNLRMLSDCELEDLLEKLTESEFDNFSIAPSAPVTSASPTHIPPETASD